MKTKNTGINKLIDLMGGKNNQRFISRKLNVSDSNFSNWKKLGYVPAKHCARVKLLSGGRVTLHELNPIDFPVEDSVLLASNIDSVIDLGEAATHKDAA